MRRRCPSRTSASPRSGVTPSSIWNSYCVGPEPVLADEPRRLGDQLLVVRRDRDVAALREQRLEAADEARAHLVGILERDRLRLEVDALAEPDVVEPRDVVERPPQPRLQHDADVVVARGAEVAVERERRVGRRGVLHVDAHVRPALARIDRRPPRGSRGRRPRRAPARARSASRRCSTSSPSSWIRASTSW